MGINAELAKELFTLLAVSIWLVFATLITRDLMNLGNLFHELMEVNKCVNLEGGWQSLDSIIWKLGGVTADRTGESELASFGWVGKRAHTLLAKGVYTWQSLGLLELIQANGTLQKLFYCPQS